MTEKELEALEYKHIRLLTDEGIVEGYCDTYNDKEYNRLEEDIPEASIYVKKYSDTKNLHEYYLSSIFEVLKTSDTHL